MTRYVYCPADGAAVITRAVIERDVAARVLLRHFAHAHSPELLDLLAEARSEEALELVRVADEGLIEHRRRQREAAVERLRGLTDAARRQAQRAVDAIDREISALIARAA